MQGPTMPRPVALLCLILAIAGQPLRQAEASGDFARALTHLLTPGGAIEIPDGGVGDDSGVATLKAGTGYTNATAGDPSCDLRGACDGLPRSFNLVPSTPGASRCRE